MDTVQDDEVLFDIRRSSRWLFDEDVQDLNRMMPISVISIGVALLFLMTIPGLWIMVIEKEPDWLLLLLILAFPSFLLYLGYDLYTSEGERKLYPRITKQAIQVPEYQGSLIGSKYVYKTIPFQSLKNVYLESGYRGMDLSIDYTDDDGIDQTYQMEYSDDGPGYEADIYGFMEALDKVHPNGPQPSSEEFMASLMDSGTGKKAPMKTYNRYSHHLVVSFGISLGYFSMFVMSFFFPLMMPSLIGEPIIFLMFVPPVVFLFIAFTPLFLMQFLGQCQSFLDNLIMDFRIEGEAARIPTPLLARIIISGRPKIEVREIKVARLHLVQHPLSNLAAVEMADGTTFLVSDDILKELGKSPWFERGGRWLVNITEPLKDGRPVARVNWAIIRLLLMAPLLLIIALAISKLVTLL